MTSKGADRAGFLLALAALWGATLFGLAAIIFANQGPLTPAQENTMTEQTTDAATEATPAVQTETITLDTPMQRGKTTVTEITVRKPKAGALRGVSLTDVLQMDVAALTKVLPRITTPAITEPEIRDMDPADLVQLGGAVASFLLPKKALATED